MRADQDDNESPTPSGHSRRGFLRSAALAGGGAAAVGAFGEQPALAADSREADSREAARAGRWRPDSTSRQFTVAVMPDT